jgi:hypothetical protein
LTIAAEAVGSDGGAGAELEHADKATITIARIPGLTSTLSPRFGEFGPAGFSASAYGIARHAQQPVGRKVVPDLLFLLRAVDLCNF